MTLLVFPLVETQPLLMFSPAAAPTRLECSFPPCCYIANIASGVLMFDQAASP